MPAAENLGKCPCPECGGLAVVNRKPPGEDGKPKLAYRWCRECKAQYFPKSQAAEAKLLASVVQPGTAPPLAAPSPPVPNGAAPGLFSTLFRAGK